MPNYLYPDTLPDIAKALVARTEMTLAPEAEGVLLRALVRHFHACARYAIPATLGPNAPDWAHGKAVSHFAPTAQLETEVERVANVLRWGRHPHVAGLAEIDPALAAEMAALARALPHREWGDVLAESERLLSWLNQACVARERVWTRRIVEAGGGKRWRRLRSAGELWDAARGTRWCLRRGGDLADYYVDMLHKREGAFWVLERERHSLALLLHDLVSDEIKEVRDRRNNAALAHRGAVRRLARWLGLDPAQCSCPDMLALAFDPDLGRRGQPHWRGAIESEKGEPGLDYRFWADGRRGRYLAAFAETPSGKASCYLRLDMRGGAKPHLTGTAPASWPDTEAKLMRAVLKQVADGRPHWKSARRALRKVLPQNLAQ